MLKRKNNERALVLEERAQRLSLRRNLKMARSAHAYVRGSTTKFYEWLDACRGHVPEGPPVWICGDCHIGNLGPLADAKGHVAIQIRDLDQTVIANPAYDLIRLGLSLASGARGSDLPGVTTARILEALIAGYSEALAGDPKHERQRPKPIQRLLRKAVCRRWRHLAEERLDNVRPTIPLGKRFWPLLPDERQALKALFEDLPPGGLFCDLKRGTTAIELVDAAYWVKGCSSLGRLRFAVLIRVEAEGGSKLRLIDVKEGVKATVPGADKNGMHEDDASRVVAGARALSPGLGDRMLPARIMDKPVVLRELAPQDLKIELDRLNPEDAVALARYLAGVVGEAHGRQMDSKDRAFWRKTLSENHRSKLEAPSWLWSSVVDLIMVHEAAYLEHCRRFALSQGE